MNELSRIQIFEAKIKVVHRVTAAWHFSRTLLDTSLRKPTSEVASISTKGKMTESFMREQASTWSVQESTWNRLDLTKMNDNKRQGNEFLPAFSRCCSLHINIPCIRCYAKFDGSKHGYVSAKCFDAN